jgi:hypothetical protein
LQKLAVINFHLRGYIKELGYEATIQESNGYEYAAAVGLEEIDKAGSFSSKRFGKNLRFADVVLTSMPLARATS